MRHVDHFIISAKCCINIVQRDVWLCHRGRCHRTVRVAVARGVVDDPCKADKDRGVERDGDNRKMPTRCMDAAGAQHRCQRNCTPRWMQAARQRHRRDCACHRQPGCQTGIRHELEGQYANKGGHRVAAQHGPGLRKRACGQSKYQNGGSANGGDQIRQRCGIRPQPQAADETCNANASQRAKGRVLMDVLQSGKADFAKAMTPAEAEQERRQTRTLTALNTALYRERLQAQPDEKRVAEFESQLQRVRLEQEAFQAGLYAAHPELKLQRGELQPLSLAEIAALLPDAHTALLEYIVAEQQTYLFVITRGTGAQPVNLQLYSLSLTGREASELPERLRRRIAHRYFDFRELGAELSQRLLTPARAQLRDKHALVIIPDGGLWQLPFQALPALSASSASGTANSRYLIEDYAISYAPSLPVLQAMMRQRAARQQPTPRQPHAGTSLLAFGDPTLGTQAVARAEALLMGDRLTPLPETARQVRALKQVYGAAHSKVLLGAAAREDVLKTEAGRYRILHLATHGILNDVNPLYSQLLLSQPETGATETADGGEDGLLEAWEIMRLNLQADLVVLSACETARGRVGSGEGIIGLTWAFFIAGSPANVVSQWKVESRSTAELMLAFHRRLQSGTTPASAAPGLATAEALRQAALTLLHKPEYRHPFYWAGFVLVGAGR